MKPDIKWIDKMKVRKTKTLDWRDDEVFQAHSVEQPNLVPYVSKAAFDEVLGALKSDDPDVRKHVLGQFE